MERAALEQITAKIDEEVRNRFTGGFVSRVEILQYGDDPVVEPGELMVRVHIADPGNLAEGDEPLETFHKANMDAIHKFREELSADLPETRRLEFRIEGEDSRKKKRITLMRPGPVETRALAGPDLTPVMARLAPVDLETLDTLITAGIASNRADAVRWTLARIRERPAYQQLRERAREIEELKSQF
jgi:hypothetical protein